MKILFLIPIFFFIVATPVLWIAGYSPSQPILSAQPAATALLAGETPTEIGHAVQNRTPFQSTPTVQPAATVALAEPTPTDSWSALQESVPYPYTAPLPPPIFTTIDGVYVKQEPTGLLVEHVHCRRCPDWLYEPGVWKIRFSQGIYRVLHVDSGWRSMGSYIVSADQLILFNDPSCLEDTRRGEIGVYRWKREKGVLTFQVIDDPCAILLRGKNLAHLPWQSCQPPNLEAVITDHWQKPNGCE